VLVGMVACGDGTPDAASCAELQASEQRFGECVVTADPKYSNGCPFVLGGLCQPDGRLSSCDPAFSDLGGLGCDLDNTNCHYDFPHCEPVDDSLVRYEVHMVHNGTAGVIRFDIDSDSCTFEPCNP
jgi:hypothetical protein